MAPCPGPASAHRPQPTAGPHTCWHLIPLQLTRRESPLKSTGLKAPAVISPGSQEIARGRGSPQREGGRGAAEPAREKLSLPVRSLAVVFTFPDSSLVSTPTPHLQLPELHEPPHSTWE